jgi:hypothetical protein
VMRTAVVVVLWEKSKYGRRKILTLADQGVDLGNNQDRICCQTSQPSKFEGIRGTSGYKKQD